MPTQPPDVRLRAMEGRDRDEVAALICASTNAWYEGHGRPPIFAGGPATTALFADVYEALDPGCCVVAADAGTGRLLGSCFYHPRETHVSVGIMNVHPAAFGRGVARQLLRFVTDLADRDGRPTRLVSSAMNLDSFSLYTRAGFVPRATFQDVVIAVSPGGFAPAADPSIGAARVRPARESDVHAMAALEREVSGIRREQDYRHFVANREGIWHVSVLDDGAGGLDGFLASVAHPASTMLGPGVARTPVGAAAMIAAELDGRRGLSPLLLVPADCPELVRQVYAWGGRNCEIHFGQVRGAFQTFRGVVLPTFMPETG